jgi:hypothetical protein
MTFQLDREQVDAVLVRVGVSAERRQELLDLVHFPADRDDVARILGPHGVTLDRLIDRLGGSP